MPTSSRFAVAIHILAGLTLHSGEPLPSEIIARSAHTNPAVIRRLLSMLNRAGLTSAQLGQGGGALLARPAAEITLLEVYRIVENQALFALHRARPDQSCIVGRYIQESLHPPLDRAIGALEAELGKTTIADIVDDIASRNAANAKTAIRLNVPDCTPA